MSRVGERRDAGVAGCQNMVVNGLKVVYRYSLVCAVRTYQPLIEVEWVYSRSGSLC